MSYFMSCQKCGKEIIGRYATEDSLCGECISDIDKLSAEKLQEQLNTAKKALTEIDSGTWHSRDRGLVVDTSNGETVSLFTLTEQALAAIGSEGSGDE